MKNFHLRKCLLLIKRAYFVCFEIIYCLKTFTTSKANRIYCIIFNSFQSLLTNIESVEADMAPQEGADKTKGFFARFTTTTTTTTTSSTSKPFLTLVLNLDTDALPPGSTMIMQTGK